MKFDQIRKFWQFGSFLMRKKKSIQYLKELLDTFPVSKDHLEYKTGLGLPIQFPNGTCNVRSL